MARLPPQGPRPRVARGELVGANQMGLSNEDNSRTYPKNPISSVDRYPRNFRQTALGTIVY